MKTAFIVLFVISLMIVVVVFAFPKFVTKSVERILPAAPIHFILEDDFRGLIKLKLYQTDGVLSTPLFNKVKLKIPSSGILKITGGDPLQKYNYPKIFFKNGQEIAFDDPNKADSNELRFFHLGRYKDGTEAWFFVGTRNQAEEIYREISSARSS